MTFLRLKLGSCNTCPDTNVLEIERVKITTDKRGKQSEHAETLVDRLLISDQEAQAVRTLANRFA
jgi:hypothetical protein